MQQNSKTSAVITKYFKKVFSLILITTFMMQQVAFAAPIQQLNLGSFFQNTLVAPQTLPTFKFLSVNPINPYNYFNCYTLWCPWILLRLLCRLPECIKSGRGWFFRESMGYNNKSCNEYRCNRG